MQSSPFLILAIFGFPLNTPLPTGRALAHRLRSRKGQSPKSAVVRGLRYQVARKRGSARREAQPCQYNAATRFNF